MRGELRLAEGAKRRFRCCSVEPIGLPELHTLTAVCHATDLDSLILQANIKNMGSTYRCPSYMPISSVGMHEKDSSPDL